MTTVNLTLSTDATVTERFLTFMLGRLLDNDEDAYSAWMSEAYTLADGLTEREFALFDLTDAVAEHFGTEIDWLPFVETVAAASAA